MKIFKIKHIFPKITWHKWPIPKDKPILSIWELFCYSLVLAVCIHFYNVCQTVPVFKNAIIANLIYLAPRDSSELITTSVNYYFPMSYVIENKDGVGGYKISNMQHLPNIDEWEVFYSDSAKLKRVNVYRELALKESQEKKDRRDSIYCFYVSHRPDKYKSIDRTVFHIKSVIIHDNLKPFIPIFNEYISDNKGWIGDVDETAFTLSNSFHYKNGFIQELFINSNVVHITQELHGKFDFLNVVSRPQLYRPYDISQSYYDITLKGDFVYGRLKFDFTGVTEFSNMVPEPDEIGMSSITFSDQSKIDKIRKDGLRFHAKFSELENIQNSRMFFLTALMSALFALLLTFIVLSLYKIMKRKSINSTE